MATAGKIIAAGEITAKILPDIPHIICQAVKQTGYVGLDYEVEIILHAQSPDIVQAINGVGAGDQGIVYGYATVSYTHLDVYKRQALVYEDRLLQFNPYDLLHHS